MEDKDLDQAFKIFKSNLKNYKLTTDFNKIHLSTKVVEIKPKTDGLTVHFETSNGKKFTESFDKVLVSVGRKPNTENLSLEETGISLTDRGFIPVNDKRQTSIKKSSTSIF